MEYQEFMDLTIMLLNKYSVIQNTQIKFLENGSLSFSEAIVMNIIVKNRDLNMTSLANNLGVTKAAITKTIKKLESRGLLLRYKKVTNKKEIFVMLSKQGEAVYLSYKNFLYDHLLKNLFHLFDQCDKELIETMKFLLKSINISVCTLVEEIYENNS